MFIDPVRWILIVAALAPAVAMTGSVKSFAQIGLQPLA